MCEGQVHKVRDDGTKIRCSQGKFKAEKGRQGKAAEVDQALEDRAKNSKKFQFPWKLLIFTFRLSMVWTNLLWWRHYCRFIQMVVSTQV